VLPNADGQGNQLLVFGAYRAFTHGGMGVLAEGLHCVGLRLAQANQAFTDVLNQLGMVKSAHSAFNGIFA
jgi:hypothetical protein